MEQRANEDTETLPSSSTVQGLQRHRQRREEPDGTEEDEGQADVHPSRLSLAADHEPADTCPEPEQRAVQRRVLRTREEMKQRTREPGDHRAENPGDEKARGVTHSISLDRSHAMSSQRSYTRGAVAPTIVRPACGGTRLVVLCSFLVTGSRHVATDQPQQRSPRSRSPPQLFKTSPPRATARSACSTCRGRRTNAECSTAAR